MRKRIMSALLALCMALTLLPVNVWAATPANGTCGTNLSWELDAKGTLTIKGTGDMSNYSLNSRAPWYDSRTSIGSVVISDGVTSIGAYAFRDCHNMKKAEIAGSVTSMGAYAFTQCSSLSSIGLPSGLTNISANAFSGCSALTSVTIPDAVTTIGASAFERCSKLTSVTIPAKVSSIGSGAFNDTGISSIAADPGNSSFTSQDGVLFTKNMKTLVAYPSKKSGSYTVPGGVTTIRAQAFEGCTGLTGVTMNTGVASIEDHAFYGCSGLTTVTVPSGASIGGYAFARSGLTSAVISSGVAYIQANAFEGCSKLASVTIPDSVTTIAAGAFKDCGALKDVHYGSSRKHWAKININKENEPLSTATIHYQKFDVEASASPSIGGTLSGTGAYLPDESVTLTAAANTNYTFERWTENGKVVSADASFTFKVTADREFMAEFSGTVLTWSVSFDSQGGSAVDSVTVVKGGTVAAPAPPTRAGYIFGGWYREKTCENKWDFGNDRVTEKITLYAQWTECTSHKWGSEILSEAKDATCTEGGFKKYIKYCENCGDSETREETIQPIGQHTWSEWEAVPDDPKLSERSCSVCGWKQFKGSLTTMLYGGKLPPLDGQTLVYDQNHTIVEMVPDPTQTGYVFDGWYTEQDGGTKLEIGGTLPDSFFTNHCIHAHWTSESDVEKFTVTFDLNYTGAPAGSTAQVSNGEKAVEPAAPTRTGFTFKGWYKEAACTTAWNFAADTVTKNITLYAKWEPNGPKQFTVIFDSNDGAATTTFDTLTTGTDGKLAALPATAPTREDYDFVGWFTERTGGEAVTTGTVFDKDTTVYAHWTEKNPDDQQVTITFDSQGGSAVASQTVDAGDSLPTLPTPTRKGYTFNGWYTEASGGTRVVPPVTFNKDTTLYARWAEVPPDDKPDDSKTHYTITFNPNGGSGGGSLTTRPSGKLSLLPSPDPIREGYTFAGWYTSASGGDRVTINTIFTGNTTVYAHWTQGSSGSGSGSGSGSDNSLYQVYISDVSYGGSIYPSHSTAAPGTVVTVELSPWSGYQLSRLTATRIDTGRTLTLSRLSSTRYTFVMPASNVRLDASFTVVSTVGGSSSGGSGSNLQPSTNTRPVNWYYSNGRIYHVTDGLVPLNAMLTRDMLVSVFYNMDENSFGDPTIWAANNNIVPDVFDTWMWGADGPISREQTAMIIFCYAQHMGYNTSQHAALTRYTDYRQIHSAARTAMSWTRAEGLINGTSSTRLSPRDLVTCEQANIILARFLTNVVGAW